MKIFYENRDKKRIPMHSRNGNHIFPAHFHQDMEFLLVRKGGYEVTVNENTYEVLDGCILIIDSYDVHTYAERRCAESDDTVVILPYRYTHRFNVARRNMKIVMPLIQDARLCDELLQLADKYFTPDQPEYVQESAGELFLALLETRLSFTESVANDESALIRKILSYIQENYRSDVSLQSTAKYLGYTTAHVSRAFHRYIKISLPEYINDLRLNYIEQQRARGDKRKIIDLVFEAGFKSQQTYYRCKNKRMTKYFDREDKV